MRPLTLAGFVVLAITATVAAIADWSWWPTFFLQMPGLILMLIGERAATAERRRTTGKRAQTLSLVAAAAIGIVTVAVVNGIGIRWFGVWLFALALAGEAWRRFQAQRRDQPAAPTV